LRAAASCIPSPDPAEKDIIRNIIPEMQEEEPVGYVTFERFERKMLDILLPSNDYLPDDDDALRQCFLALDKERVGYVTAETMSMLLTTKGTPMRPKELEAFLKAAKCPDTGRIYYDDYIALMTKDIGFA
jgi:Ca2+-binding EF-hand superfamily protein